MGFLKLGDSEVLFKQLLKSPTATSWLNLLSKTLGLFLLTPLIITSYDSSDVLVWYVILSLSMLVLMFDLGFTPTAIRYLVFANENNTNESCDLLKLNIKVSKLKTKDFKIYIEYLVISVYRKMSFIAFISSILFGSIYVYGFFNNQPNEVEFWISWFVFCLCISFRLYGNKNIALLQATKNYAFSQKIMMLSNIIAILISVFVVIFDITMPYVILIYSTLSCTYLYLAQVYIIKNNLQIRAVTFDRNKEPYRKVSRSFYKNSLKSGSGILFSTGLFQSISLVIAKVYSADVSSIYLFLIQIIRSVGSFSQIPFYAKIPSFNRMYQSSSKIVLSESIFKADILSVFLMFIGTVIVAVYIKSPFQLWEPIIPEEYCFLWLILSSAFILERQSAIKVQIYSLTNHIIWHYLNGITCLVISLLLIFLFPINELNSFPIALILACLFVFYPASVFFASKVIQRRALAIQCVFSFILVFLILFWSSYEINNNFSYM